MDELTREIESATRELKHLWNTFDNCVDDETKDFIIRLITAEEMKLDVLIGMAKSLAKATAAST